MLICTAAAAQQIVSAEYFLGPDPGPGNGTPVTITADNSILLNTLISTESFATGFNSISLRTKSNSGLWSNTVKRNFYVEIASPAGNLVFHEIVAAEYFIDTDPGPGNGIPININAAAAIELSEVVPTNLSNGFHKLAIRVRSTDGYWSSTVSRHFIMQPASPFGDLQFHEIIGAEYFIGSDPGPGNGTAIDLNASSSVNFGDAFTADLAPGFYNVVVRTQANSGLWSSTVARRVLVRESSTSLNASIIEAAEYFFDTDPGPGNGIPITINPSDSISISGEIDLSEMAFGDHIMFIRFKGASGLWSNSETATFGYCGDVPPLALFEYTTDGFQVFYENTSEYSGPSITWNLPGMSISGVDAPTQTLPSPGTYSACLTINSICGNDINCNVVVIADTIQITSVNPAQLNQGETTDIAFTTNFTDFAQDNIFTLLMSDETGSFQNPVELAQINSDTASIFEDVLIPLSTQASCYSLKVISSNPIHSSPDGTEIKVNNATFEPGNYALSLDGIDDRADAGALLTDHDFTVSFWVKPDGGTSQTGAIIDMQNDLALYENPDLPNNYVLLHLLQFDLLPNDWNHVTITMDAETNTRRVYLFGQLVEENVYDYTPVADYHLILGGTNCSYCGGNFKGLIDEFKCWDLALDQETIFNQMNNAPLENDPNLIAYYTFDEGCFSEALDNSLFGNDAALLNGASFEPSDLIQGSTSIYPESAGNNGLVTLHIEGDFFPDTVIVMLSNDTLGQIIADTMIVTNNHELILAYLDLTNQPLGMYDVIVLDYEGNSYNYPQSFTIVPADTIGGIEIEILGQNTIRDGGKHVFFIVYENTSNVNLPIDIRVLTCNYTDWMGFDDQQLMYHYQQLPIALCDRIISDEGVTYLDEWLSPGVQYVIPIYAISTTDGTRDVNCDELSPFILEGAYPNRTDEEGANAGGPFGGHNYIDGCSAPDVLMPVVNFQVNADVDWNQIFLPTCMNHDLCYQQCYRPGTWERAQAICDLNMYNEMCDICNQLYGDWELTDPFPSGFDVIGAYNDAIQDGRTPYTKCLKAAGMYYSGLRLFGKPIGFDPDQEYCTGNLEQPEPSDVGENFLVLDCNCPGRAICFKPRRISSFDPNIKIGPDLYQNNTMEWAYSIYFENADSATASAQSVTIIDTLDITRYDLSSFSFTGYGFGESQRIFTTTTSNAFSETIDLPSHDSTLVRVTAFMDQFTGIVQWQFTALDSVSLQPVTGVYDGFLPPNDSTGRGQGFVLFSINPLEGLATGDSVSNRASIYFDYNDPIITDWWTNLLDFTPPSSYIDELDPFVTDSVITLVLWGEDTLLTQEFTLALYLSIDGGPYELWQSDITDSVHVFNGSPGHSYSFYTIATDAAGNEENAPDVSDATTFIYAPGTPISYVIQSVSPSCANQHDGTLSIAINGTSPVYHYAWNGVSSGSIITDLSEGAYSLIVRDVFDIVVLDTVLTIADPTPIAVTLNVQPALCYGEASGIAEVFATGGTGTISVDWMGENPQALASGVYNITVYDENQCSVDTSLLVTEPEAVSVQIIDVTSSDANCNGSITIEPSGGVPPYIVNWNDNQNQVGTSATNLCEGSYTASVTDANDCSTSISVDVLLDMEESLEVENGIDIWPNPVTDNCTIEIRNNASHQIVVSVFNDLGQQVIAPRTVSLSNGKTSLSIDLSGIASGNYWLEAVGDSSILVKEFLIVKN
jgi:hypothetical protein